MRHKYVIGSEGWPALPASWHHLDGEAFAAQAASAPPLCG